MDNVWVVVPDQMAYSGPPADEPASTYQAVSQYGFVQRPEQDVPVPFTYTGPVMVYPTTPAPRLGFFAWFRAERQAQQARMRAKGKPTGSMEWRRTRKLRSRGAVSNQVLPLHRERQLCRIPQLSV